MSNCPTPTILSSYRSGSLRESHARLLESHVAQCPQCQAMLQSMRETKTVEIQASAIEATAGSGSHEPDETEAQEELLRFLRAPAVPGEVGQLGDYRIRRILGRGGMGMVFEALDTKLHRAVALKVMLPAIANRTTARERFLREARAAAAITHDHIVTIYQVGEDRDVPFMAMQLLRGMNLQDWLKQKNGPVSPWELFKIGREIAKGLAAAHERGLVHRDIKPGNIWLDQDAEGRVKILDFGLVGGGDGDTHLTQSGVILGTPAYMAPEQARGALDARSDLFSLGCVLYRMVTGRMPFHGPDAMAMLMSIAIETPPSPQELNPHLPDSLSRLIMQMLAKSPTQRPAKAMEVAQRLTAIEQEMLAGPRSQPIAPVDVWRDIDMPTEFVQYEPEPPAPLPPSRRQWPLLVGSMFGVFGLLLAGYLLFVGPSKPTVREVVEVPTPTKKEVVKVDPPKVVPFDPFERWLADTLKLPAVARLEAVRVKLQELNPKFAGDFRGDADPMKPSIVDDQVVRLDFVTDHVTDIRPLRALPELRLLAMPGLRSPDAGKLSDLSPLRGMKLTQLRLHQNPNLADLSPLEGMRLTFLSVASTAVSDLTPLVGAPLETLHINSSSKFTDLAILQRFPLKFLRVTIVPGQDLKELRKLWNTGKINDINALEFWRVHNPAHADYLQWIEDTRQLARDDQLKAVIAKLIDRNPGFDGKLRTSGVAGGRHLWMTAIKLLDISPVRAISDLAGVTIQGRNGEAYQPFEDLSPLRGLDLQSVLCPYTSVSNLWPLAGMRLTALSVSYTRVSDMAPLRGMKLNAIYCYAIPVPSLRDLRGMPIHKLDCGTRLSRDYEALRSIVGLEEIDLLPVDQFWKKTVTPDPVFEEWVKSTSKLAPQEQLTAVITKLIERNDMKNRDFAAKVISNLSVPDDIYLKFPTENVYDISPLRAMPGLRRLHCYCDDPRGGWLVDLSPLKGIPLTSLAIGNNPVRDLTPLSEMKTLTFFNCEKTDVADLTPVQKLPLRELFIEQSRVVDLTPIAAMTELVNIRLSRERFPNLAILRTLPKLKTIND